MTLMAGWFEKNNWGVAYQIISPEEILRPLRGREVPGEEEQAFDLNQELLDFFQGGLILATTQNIPEGANLMLFFHPPGSPCALVVGAQNLHTAPQLRAGDFHLSLRVLSIRESPLDGIQRLG